MRSLVTASRMTGSASVSLLTTRGSFGLGRQVAAHPAHGVAHVVGSLVDVAADVELDDDAAGATPALRLDRLDAADAGDRALDDFGDVGVDDLGRRAGIARW
jgi:hypothetical protein